MGLYWDKLFSINKWVYLSIKLEADFLIESNPVDSGRSSELRMCDSGWESLISGTMGGRLLLRPDWESWARRRRVIQSPFLDSIA